MNLETLEERALAYLAQVSNPLVRVSMLREYLLRDESAAPVSESALNEFIEDHERIRVIRPLDLSGLELGEGTETPREEPCVILAERVPTQDQLSAMMIEQLDVLGESLALALREARAATDSVREKEIKAALDRTAQLKSRVVEHFKFEAKGSGDSAE